MEKKGKGRKEIALKISNNKNDFDGWNKPKDLKRAVEYIYRYIYKCIYKYMHTYIYIPILN
jgi:hypothetical protein